MSTEEKSLNFIEQIIEEDLKNGVLRATSPAFAEDPLRVLRGLQLVSRLSIKKCKNCGCLVPNQEA